MTILELSPHHLAIYRHLASKFTAATGNFEVRYVLDGRTDGTMLDDQLDAVLLDEVAHHIEPPQQLFVYCARLLRPGGTLFRLELSPWHLVTQAFFLCARDLKTVIQMTLIETHAFRNWPNDCLGASPIIGI
jgi:2-polyprenyl-3-methyl-5-hydroxy-6-metoxy-1,4-benzoquinol methylase